MCRALGPSAAPDRREPPAPGRHCPGTASGSGCLRLGDCGTRGAARPLPKASRHCKGCCNQKPNRSPPSSKGLTHEPGCSRLLLQSQCWFSSREPPSSLPSPSQRPRLRFSVPWAALRDPDILTSFGQGGRGLRLAPRTDALSFCLDGVCACARVCACACTCDSVSPSNGRL